MYLFDLFNKKNRKVKLKEKVQIEQRENCIYIHGKLNNTNYDVKGLKLHVDDEVNPFIIENETYNNYFDFTINLDDYVDEFDDNERIYQFFLIVCVKKENLTESQIQSLLKKPTTIIIENGEVFEYPIRMGRFEKTYTNGCVDTLIQSKVFRLYKTIKGNISLAVNKEVKQKKKIQIDYIKSRSSQIKFGGKLFTRTEEINGMKLLIIGRNNNIETSFPVEFEHLTEKTKQKFGLNRYKYKAHLNFDTLFKDENFTEDTYDLYFDIKWKGNIYNENKGLIRIGKPRFMAKYNIKASQGKSGKHIMSVTPYYTFRGENLSLQAVSFEKDIYKYLRNMMRFSVFIRLWNRKKNIWIVGERIYKAQDTGYHFFKYVRENHPDKKVYYVIDPESPELRNVSPYGNVLISKSKEHIKMVLSATRIIGSHHPDYLYPLRTHEFKRKVKAQKVFLQHGIMGTKNMVANYGKTASDFETDLFLVSSQNEKDMIVNDFEYNPKEVKVTGLSRFDSLFKGNVKTKRQLLIIPTWREWLIREDLFLESEYFHRYKSLVNNEQLRELAKENQFEIVFCLHPNMQKYSHLFEEDDVRVINQGEVDVQILLKESMMMITDYSSVAFDFSFLERPVVYYQFDRNRFIGKRPSHLTLDKDLPGEIVYEEELLLDLVHSYAQSDFKMKPEYIKRSNEFVAYKDQNSSKRIFEVVEKGPRKKPLYEKAFNTELYKAIFNRFRKSKYYFPIMKMFYTFVSKCIPVDNKLIVFESGIGKQFGDSPKNIYDEIVEQNLDYKKIWVVNKKVRFKDIENTKRIKRLSPSYYYYLARAKVWINNQNFPTYIKKRPDTTYLQTWHGTPLKKMLFDIENIMGRSEDYLDRVSNAIGNWDYLVSPSKFASEAFRSAFRYKGNIIETGYPRNDLFYMKDTEEKIKDIKVGLNIPLNKKIILYAPTFRDNQATKKNKFTFNLEMDLHSMMEKLCDEYILLIRMHVVVNNKIAIENELSEFVWNVSNYPDMQNLLLISDVFITDYSSAMFDFANTKRPMLFFTYDYETYKNEVRGFYLDFEKEAPGPFVMNTDEIISSIHNINEINKKYELKYKGFYEKYCELDDGKASKRVVDYLLDNDIVSENKVK